MCERDNRLYIADILDSAQAIKQFTDGMSFDEFVSDRKTYSATIREYIVIGEAVGQLIDMLEKTVPDYPWRMVKDFKNFNVREYFGVDARIVWDMTMRELDDLITHIQKLKYKIS